MSSSALPDHPSSGPGSSLTHQEIRQWAHKLARLLDATWIIPGTQIKIGLDPLLGLIPGIGDVLSNAVGSLLLFLATKAGVPRIVIVRMALNVCINMAMGAIPGWVMCFRFGLKVTSGMPNSWTGIAGRTIGLFPWRIGCMWDPSSASYSR